MTKPNKTDLDNFAAVVAGEMHHPNGLPPMEVIGTLVMLVTHAGVSEGICAVMDYYSDSNNKGSLARVLPPAESDERTGKERPMKTFSYQTISEDSSKKLDEVVNEEIQRGWTPHGGVCVVQVPIGPQERTRFVQALVKLAPSAVQEVNGTGERCVSFGCGGMAFPGTKLCNFHLDEGAGVSSQSRKVSENPIILAQQLHKNLIRWSHVPQEARRFSVQV